MPTGKTIRRRAANRKAAGDVVDDDLYEDLDLDVGVDAAPLHRSKRDTEEDIVFNRKTKTRKLAAGGGDDDDMDDDEQTYKSQLLSVNPREAHHDAREGVRGAFAKKPFGKKGSKHADLFDDDDDDEDLDEAALAAQISRQDRRRLAEEDFEIGLPQGLSGNVMPEEEDEDEDAPSQQQQSAEDVINMQVNSVAGRFAALSASERLKMIAQQSPEVTKLMEELEKNLSDLKDIFAPLRHALFERKKALQSAGDSMLLEFLETKVQLMLSYCVHILFYLLLKVEGSKVEGHPVLKRLVELRVYLEKLHPVELRLQHSINRLLSGNSSAAAEGARLGKVRNLRENEEASKAGKYVAKKSAPVIDDLRQRRRADRLADQMKSLEKEEERTMQRKRLTRAESAKLTGSLDQVALDNNMQEEEDQYLANASSFLGGGLAGIDGDDDDDDEKNDKNGGGAKSLIERLRARKQQQQQQKLTEDGGSSNNNNKNFDSLISGKNNKQNQKELKKRLRAQREQDEIGAAGGAGEDDAEENDDDDDEDVIDFDDLEQEQEEREAQQRADKKHRIENPYEEATSDRREVDSDIKKHRGLTKNRPKDRKNPRANQRRKFGVGLRAAKAQNKRVADGAERETGSAPLKTHVVHSTKFK